jgi:hypothetical protein
MALMVVGLALLLMWALIEGARLAARGTEHGELMVGSSLMTAARIAGVVGAITAAGAGVLGPAFTGARAPVERGPTQEEMARANADYNTAVAQCAAEREQLTLARAAAFAAVPEAKEAFAASEAAISAALTARKAAEDVAAETRQAAEQKAQRAELDAQEAADRAMRDLDPEADRRAAIQKATDAYDRRYAEIGRGEGSPAVKAEQREKAKAERDGAIEQAEAAFRAAAENAERQRRRAYGAAQEKHIADVQAARNQEDETRAKAAAAARQAIAAADAELAAALQRTPAASAIAADFNRRDQELKDRCAAATTAIFARLRGRG